MTKTAAPWVSFDVFGPLLVVSDFVHAEPYDFDVPLVELALELRYFTQLGGADWREVLGVREQHGPTAPDPVVKLNGTLCRIGFEIWSRISQTNCHNTSPSKKRP